MLPVGQARQRLRRRRYYPSVRDVQEGLACQRELPLAVWLVASMLDPPGIWIPDHW